VHVVEYIKTVISQGCIRQYRFIRVTYLLLKTHRGPTRFLEQINCFKMAAVDTERLFDGMSPELIISTT
jgi:hypothetical protein